MNQQQQNDSCEGRAVPKGGQAGASKAQRTRGRPPVTALSLEPLVLETLALLAKARIPESVAAEAAGLSRNSVSNWRRRTAPNVLTLNAVLNVIGYRLVIRPLKGKMPREPKPAR